MKKRRFIKVGANVEEDDEEVNPEGNSNLVNSSGWSQYSHAPWGFANAQTSNGASTAAKYLEKEKKGERRSWCAWCDRVVPAEGEK
jgi:hypothetical protein